MTVWTFLLYKPEVAECLCFYKHC